MHTATYASLPVFVGGEGDVKIAVVVDNNGEATDVVINRNVVSIHNFIIIKVHY